jgi:prolyl oligopeptidase
MTRPAPYPGLPRLAAAVLLGWFACAGWAQVSAPPAAAAHLVSERHFGVTVEDPYRYLENVADPKVQRWFKAQHEHARATLAAVPGRHAMLDKLTRLEASVPERVTRIKRIAEDTYFMQRRGVADNQFKLVMRQGLANKDKVLLDPQALENRTRKPHAIDWFSPSPDGTLVAFGMSKGGSEAAVMSILNTRGGRTLGAPIMRADLGRVDWTPDSKALVFNRLQALGKNMGPAQKYEHSQVHLLRVGSPPASARPVFGTAIKGLDIAPADLPTVEFTHDGRWAIGRTTQGQLRELGLFVAPQSSVLAGKPQWKRIAGTADGVTSAAYFNNTLYLVSHKGAPRGRVLALALDAPHMHAAKELIPELEQVVEQVAAAADALYIETRDGNVKRLYKRSYAAAASAVEVALPVQGAFTLVAEGWIATHPRLPGAIVELQAWNRARQVYSVAADGNVLNTGLQPAGRMDAPADLVSTEVKVKSHDGAVVPMTLVHRKNVVLDGNNPTLLSAYASFGATEEPQFSVSRLAWLDAGGVIAVANPRGSGIHGQDWYRAGIQANKANGWKDFIACAEHLIAEKYTQPGKLGMLGAGAGGILVGRALTERPELFAAAVVQAGVLDTVRFETTARGSANVAEFGSVHTESGFKALLAMSTYANLRTGTAYPAVLLTHGVNDARVDVWQSAKTAARLAAAKPGAKVLLRLDFDAGHGIGDTKKQRLEERADVYSFLLWQMGVAGFQH